MKTRIHVNQFVIRENMKTGNAKPVLTVKTYKSNDYASEVEILGADGEVVGKFYYSPDHPLACGAKVWFSTENEVRIVS